MLASDSVREHPSQESNGVLRNGIATQNGKDGNGLLVRDATNSLSVIRNLQPADVILLLTPLVLPVSEGSEGVSDLFECFGRALESRHSRIRHQSYTDGNGITSTHVGFITRAKVIILVVNDAEISDRTPQIDAAHVTRVVAGDEKPVIIVLTNNSLELRRLSEDFPTVIQSKDYSMASLEMTASVIFGEV